jgi:nitrite reductase (NADH) large subunit
MSKKKTLVVIGNGMVGQYFFATLMDSPLKDNFEVVTFCEERIAAYDRIHLSEYFFW